MSENQRIQTNHDIIKHSIGIIALMAENLAEAASQCETKCECENWRKSMSDALEQIKELTIAGNFLHEWSWRMMENGTRRWRCDTYHTDEQMREWCELFEVPLPSQLKD